MTDFLETCDDPDEALAIVLSMRTYITACASSGKLPQMSHMVEIAYGLDASTKAFIEVMKIGPEDDEDLQ